MDVQRRPFPPRPWPVYDRERMARLLRRSALAIVVALATMALLLGCKGKGERTADDAGADGGDAGIGIDVNLPETVIVYLDASTESVGTTTTMNGAAAASPLPRPCTDKALGTVTFAEDAEKVSISSSKGGMHATCVRLDEHKLLCDWFDGAGNPTVMRKAVTFGAKTKIGGSYDTKHAFSCPAQDDAPPKAPAPKPPTGRKAPKR